MDKTFRERSPFWDKTNPKSITVHNIKNIVANFSNDPLKIKKYTKEIETVLGGTAQVTILGNGKDKNYIVKKHFLHSDRKFGQFKLRYDPEDCFRSELIALILLHGKDHFPQILYYDEKTLSIFMTYCGKRFKSVNPIDYPRDWKKQMTEIHRTLQNKNIYHNDFCASNLCLKDGTLYVIDFGFAKNHIDICFKNLAIDVIKDAISLEDLLAKTCANSKIMLNSIYLS